MLEFFKYLPKLLMGKNVYEMYKAEHQGKEKPWVISLRFIGALVTFLSVLVYSAYNITITPDTLSIIIANVKTLYDAIVTICTAISGACGAVVFFIGLFRKMKRGATV